MAAGTLYVSDLDFTLLRSDRTLGRFTIDVINRFVARGGLFTYATARSFESAHRVTSELDLTLPVITYGGTITAAAATGAPGDLRLLPQHVAAALYTLSDDAVVQPIFFTFEDGQDWIRWHPDRETAGIRVFLEARSGDRRLRPITATDPMSADSLFYVSVLGDRVPLEALRRSLASAVVDCAIFLGPEPSTPDIWWLEFHDAAGTKARAIERLADTIGATRLVVFGDNNNDVPMFEIADEGYAVENAVPHLRQMATATIGSNDAEGVARWLSTHVEEREGHR